MWIQNNIGGSGGTPPENFEINGAIWCVLGPPESFLDQRKSIYFSINMEMNSFTYYKKKFCQTNVDSAAYSRIGSYAPADYISSGLFKQFNVNI